jgi:hypothetical protein
MTSVLPTISTPTFAEAVEAVSVPCWRHPVSHRRQLTSAVALAGRRVR